MNAIETLKKKGCKVIYSDESTAVVKCRKSYLVKPSSSQWKVLISSDKLSDLQKLTVSGPKPQIISIGRFIRSGSWGRVFTFNVNNEVRYNFDEKSIHRIKDPEIKKILDDMRDQEKLFREEIHEFDIQKDYKKNVYKLSERLNEILRSKLKEATGKPIVCHSEPQTRKFWFPEGERIVYRIASTCIVPESKKKVDLVINTLNDQTISQSDIRYITSKMTDDKSLMLSGIHLYQRGFKHPIIEFTVKNEGVFGKPKFMDTLKKLESNFSNKHESQLKELKKESFERFLF